MALGGQDIADIQAYELRQHIIILDRPNAIEMTMREYLNLSARDGQTGNTLEVELAPSSPPTSYSPEDRSRRACRWLEAWTTPVPGDPASLG